MQANPVWSTGAWHPPRIHTMESVCRLPQVAVRPEGAGNGALALGPKLPRPSSTLPEPEYQRVCIDGGGGRADQD